MLKQYICRGSMLFKAEGIDCLKTVAHVFEKKEGSSYMTVFQSPPNLCESSLKWGQQTRGIFCAHNWFVNHGTSATITVARHDTIHSMIFTNARHCWMGLVPKPGSFHASHFHMVLQPLSTGITAPLMPLLASDARYSTIDAICSGCSRRSSG